MTTNASQRNIEKAMMDYYSSHEQELLGRKQIYHAWLTHMIEDLRSLSKSLEAAGFEALPEVNIEDSIYEENAKFQSVYSKLGFECLQENPSLRELADTDQSFDEIHTQKITDFYVNFSTCYEKPSLDEFIFSIYNYGDEKLTSKVMACIEKKLQSQKLL